MIRAICSPVAGVLLAVPFLLVACGGGGGDAPATPTPPEAADSMLLPLVTAAGDLKLFDPKAPASAAVTVDTGVDLPFSFPGSAPFSKFVLTGVNRVLAGTYDAATNTVRDGHYRYLLYLKGGSIFRVDLLRGNVHTPAQVSSVTDACALNGYALDFANPLNTGVLVETAGTDADCAQSADNAGRYFRLGEAANDAGVPAAGTDFIFESMLAADGTLQYVLAEDSVDSTARRFDANFGNPVDILALNAGSIVGGGPDQSRTTIYFRARPSGETLNRIYRYDMANNVATPVYQQTTNLSLGTIARADDSYLYFADGNVVRRLAHGSTTPEVIHTAAANLSIEEVDMTANRLIVQAHDSDTGQSALWSLPKAGASTLTPLEAPTFEPIGVFTTAGTQVYYMTGDPNLGTIVATRVPETGTGKVQYPVGSSWGGDLLNTQFSIAALDQDLAERALLLGQADSGGNVTVKTVTATTGVLGATLGTIAGAISATSFDYGRYVLSSVEINRGSATDFDVYFADAKVAGSLRAVATTDGTDDAAVQ